MSKLPKGMLIKGLRRNDAAMKLYGWYQIAFN